MVRVSLMHLSHRQSPTRIHVETEKKEDGLSELKLLARMGKKKLQKADYRGTANLL